MKRTIQSLGLAVALGSLLLVQTTPARAQVVVDSGGSSSLVTSGLVTFGLAYGAAAVVAATSNHPGDNRLYVPLLGPWLDLGDRGKCSVGMASCDHETINKVLIVGDGVIQAVGALTLLRGLMEPTTRPVASTKSFSIAHIVPVTFGSGRPGLAAYGSF